MLGSWRVGEARAAARGLPVALALVATAAAATAAQSTGEVAGRVVTAEGEPAADAEVRLISLARTARAGADGSFRFEGVPAGTYLVEAVSERSGRALERVTVERGERREVVLVVSTVYHGEALVVTAGARPLRESETYQATKVLSGEDLRLRAQATLGETLADELGVTSTYFGPGASRPVIRGLGGDRIRVLEAGVGTGDASNTSPDHAVSVEPLTAERIEIVRGPATLLYGSSAIGGVVNVIDRRIPGELPTRPLTGQITLRGGTVADERNGAAELNGAVGRIAWHASLLGRKTDDYAIPGFAEAHHEEEEGEEEEHEDEPFGILPNSFVETVRGAFGLSWVGERGYLGAAVSGYDNKYGVPGHGHDHEEEEGEEHEEEGTFIDGRQRRVDVEGAWRFGGRFAERARVRFGYSDYHHAEVEGGEVGTRFDNDEWEARAELEHRVARPLGGMIGAQLRRRDFAALGEEAFVPPTDTDAFALFAFEELGRGPLRAQVGARWERQSVTNRGTGAERDDDALSASLGLNWSPSPQWTLALSASRSIKLPTAEELFSDGPHLATRAFEVGDPALEAEVGYSADLTARVVEGPARASATLFVTRFRDFIYQAFTGEEEDGLPVLRYTQDDAVFRGFEAEVEVDVFHHGEHGHHLVVQAFADHVRAKLTGTDRPLPRIPPLRFGTGLLWETGPVEARTAVRRVTGQERVAELEEPTPGYTMMNGSVGIRFFSGDFVHRVTLQGTNLTNEEARSHVSFLKEVAPLPGREVRLTYTLFF